MMIAIPFSLKTMESLQNGVGTYFQVTPLISMRSKSLASSQSCRSLDADAGSLALQLLVNTVEVSTGINSSGLKFNG